MRAQQSEFYKKLFSLVLPIAFQQFMLALVGASDAAMLGLLDQNLLSAASLAGQVTFVYNLFLAAMTIGTSIFAAQYYGKGDYFSVEKILAIVLRITGVVSAGFFGVSMLVPRALMCIFTSDPVLIQAGIPYLRIVGITFLACSVSQIYLCIMKNSGRAVKSVIISSVTVVLNIVLNAVFIFGVGSLPQMGITGAALATAIARIAELIWTLRENGRKDSIKIRMVNLAHIDRSMQKDFWKYTLPVLGNELVWGCGFAMYSVIMGHLGTDAVAANSIANIIRNLLACFCLGLGSGAGIIVGNELGAGNLERAREYGRKSCIVAIASGAFTGLVLLTVTPLILRMVNVSVQADIYLKGMLMMCSYYLTAQSVNNTTIAGIFCAGGDSRFGLACDTVTFWLVTVPLSLLAAFVLHLPVLVVYLIMTLDEIVKLPAVYLHYKKYRWVKNLTEKRECLK
ncbi:MAG: MATE family efflux transporter [Hespellia sp.]|nr:MATE family efflux transporter [Hespellia sp.]